MKMRASISHSLKKFIHCFLSEEARKKLRRFFAQIRLWLAHGKAPKWLEQTGLDLRQVREVLGNEVYQHFIDLAYAYRNRQVAMQEMALFLCHSGLQDEGIILYDAALATYGEDEMPPETTVLPSLQMMMFGSAGIHTPKRMYEKHTYWGQRMFGSDRVYHDYPNALETTRPLRICYTCHFVTNSTSSTLLLPLLKAHDPKRVEVYMYSDEAQHSADRPEEYKDIYESVDHWRNTPGMSTDEFCEQLRADKIDILMELNGLVGRLNRYAVIGRHPVPVQMAWHNYANTTGIPGMDYTLLGEDISIGHLQPYYSETIFQKRGAMHAMPVADHFPEVAQPPFEQNGYITFCSFGQVHKVNRAQVLKWCEVLKRVPHSRFYMKASAFSIPAYRQVFLKHFSDGGIDQSRLILEAGSDYATLLKCYSEADIALDTFPYNAGTTTVEALCMGVPVVSELGDTYASQIARPNQGTAGHPELLADSAEEFIEKAVALANDPERIRHYRQNLREDFRQSQRGDVPRFVSELEDAYAELWRRFVEKQTREAA